MIGVPPMRYIPLCVVALALCVPGPAAAGTVVSAFYYPWFGTTAHDGGYEHWSQGGRVPPDDIASNFYPALGVYSSSSLAVVDAQMRRHRARGDRRDRGLVVGQGLGRGSAAAGRDRRGDAATDRGRRAPRALRWPHGREHARRHRRTCGGSASARSTSTGRSTSRRRSGRRRTTSSGRKGVEVFAQTTLVGAAATGRFTGVYTYDTLLYGGGLVRAALQAGARARPALRSVGRARLRRAAGDRRPARQAAPRTAGRTTRCGSAAIRAGADRITITSLQRVARGDADRAGLVAPPAAGRSATARTTAPGGCAASLPNRHISAARPGGRGCSGSRRESGRRPQEPAFRPRAARGAARILRPWPPAPSPRRSRSCRTR